MTTGQIDVVVTGAGGALGAYTLLHMKFRRAYKVRAIDRVAFNNAAALQDAVASADVVLHLAGMNRGNDAELTIANPQMARQLVAALEATHSQAHVLYSSSLHENVDDAYGRSKREAGDILADWAHKHGASFNRFLLPHIYSELVRPYYNSAIATFCHQVAAREEPTVINDAVINPMHASEVCSVFDEAIATPGGVVNSPLGPSVRVGEILDIIQGMSASYIDRLLIPDLGSSEKLHLFNTYRAHLFPLSYPMHPKLHEDERGAFLNPFAN